MTFEAERYTPRVLTMARRFGYSEQEMQQVLDSPFHVWRAESDEADVYLGDRLALIVSDAGLVVALTTGKHARWVRQQPRPGAIQRKRGGRGNLGPTSIGQLIDRARKAGLEVCREATHLILRDSTGRQVTVAKTPSDHRTIPNSVAEIRRTMHVDLKEK